MRSWILLVIFVVLCAPSVQGDVFDGAGWLRDPRAMNHVVADYYGRESDPVPAIQTPTNLHTLFRGAFTVPEKPAKAVLYVTGDDYFKCYLNGYFAVQGPEPAYPFSHPYFTLDVTELVEPGANLLAAHVYYQGLRNRVWNSGDNRSGFMAVLELDYADGSRQYIKSSSAWRSFPLEANTGERIFGYQTQFAEDTDLRRVPRGWQFPGFDDSAWPTAVDERQDHEWVPSAIPPLQRYRLDPVVRKLRPDGAIFFDFGKEIVGHTAFRAKGEPGQALIVRHGEELLAPDTVRFKMRATRCDYEETIVLTGQEDFFEFFDYRGFRYVEVLNAPEDFELWAQVRHYPYPENAALFSSQDDLVNRIWELCRNGVVMGTQGGFLDCPTREKGQYLGDGLIGARAHLWLTGDPLITGKAVRDFALSSRIHPGIMGVAPGNFMQEIAEYSLQFPLMVQHYYEHSGDEALTSAIVENIFPGLFEYFAGFENENGLLVGMNKPEKWLLVDWPGNLRDGYDYDASVNAGNTVLNAFYYGSLETAAALSQALDLDGVAYAQRAVKVKTAIQEHMIDKQTGLYVDAPGSTHSSLHANAVPLFFGLTEGANLEAMLNLIDSKGLSCGLYMAAFVIEACFKNGAGDLGWRLMSGKATNSWHEMLKHGATAPLEVWAPDLKGNTSWCHPWGSSPIFLITEYVLGLKPGAPGWKSISFAPVMIQNLPEMRLEVPLPLGRVAIHYAPGAGYTLSVPQGMAQHVKQNAPDGMTLIVNEKTIKPSIADTKVDNPILEAHGWHARVGDGLGVWVDVNSQSFKILRGKNLIWQAVCATAEKGTGQVEGSYQTPLGWHTIDSKIGEGADWGQVFRSRQPTKEIWKAGADTIEDLVLTRILWLSGLEPGVNQGNDSEGRVVDSRRRFIYIHGTNGEEIIGTPSSHGCIRLLNDDVIEVFDMLPVGTPVLITETKPN